MGCSSPDPIFIIGMPRAGSTLLEQILSSHSAVEGTSELPDMISLAHELRKEAETDQIAAYTTVLPQKNAAELQALGERYIESTRIHRKTDLPFFIDKMPNNFLYAGVILDRYCPTPRSSTPGGIPWDAAFPISSSSTRAARTFSYSMEHIGRFYSRLCALDGAFRCS